MEKQIVSVIIPIYNGAQYISDCINSIQNQTYKKLDIIIVDDGSTDKSYEICEKIAKIDNRIKLFKIKNSGVSFARNYGLTKGIGEFVTFIDSDDIVEQKYIEILISFLEKKCDIAICGTKYFTNIGEIDSPNWIERDKIINISEFDISSSIQHITVWGMIVRKNILDGIKFDTSIFVGEDALFFFQILKRSNWIGYSCQRLYKYRIQSESASKGRYNLKKFTEVLAWEKISQLYIDDKKCYKKACGEWAIRCIHVFNLMCIAEVHDIDKEIKLFQVIRKNAFVAFKVARDSRYRISLIIIFISPRLYRNLYSKKEMMKVCWINFNGRKKIIK